MNELKLTEDQQALVDAEDSLFAAACPGAGKTRAMVARYLKRTAEERRRGIALISFTNAAVDEVRRRCGTQAEALRVPHFVGTFDTFIHRFIVTPLYVKAYGRKPNYLQSWTDVSATSFRLVPDLGRATDLEFRWFDFEPDGRAHLDLNRVPNTFGDVAVHRLLARRKHEAETKASHIFGRLLEAGTISCEAARLLAAFWLNSPKERVLLKALLRARFAEIIVDETQDCGREELDILRFLRDCKVRVVMVGDLDQSIYEFRNATPTAVQEFAADLPVQLQLEDNWRSSPAICAFNSGLRSGQLVERARGEHSIVQTPVHLIEFSALDQIVPAALDVAEQYKLAADDLVLLSHAEAHGMKAAGVGSQENAGSNRVLAIAHAGFKIKSQETDPKTRKKAIDQVQRAILKTLTVGRDIEHHGFAGICEEIEVDPRWLDSFAVRMILSLDAKGKSRADFAAEVRNFLKTADWGGGPAPTASDLGKLFKAPSEAAWASVASFGNSPSIRYSTVHGVKGMEFPGVVLVLPERLRVDKATERTVLDDWEGDFNTEARRVLYVAGSRAQELLVCAVHRKHTDRVAALLDAKGVPYVRRP
ncbi:DNA helicase-2/ATP-dependent DNA helicase PcrA [Streptomyces canus]|uniref:DNA 3'-5' helicase n=1 Tax=Streptomyces griseoaurantiacus M045 TaxID=996637 RepID=F3NE19_9ACTN|nr:UvrD-helicase domain-containing protein [Streptomyces griseoaurantiacus]EGG48289.1 putative ATP-dependent DNA helicase [Streptomyces griseoaurantiacus M045]